MQSGAADPARIARRVVPDRLLAVAESERIVTYPS
jgi:hypothetical protein